MLKIKIEEDKEVICSNTVVLFDNPSYVFISFNHKEVYLPLLKKGEYVYQEEQIAFRKKDHFPLFSSVSGIIKNVDARGILIENDFKNRVRNHQLIEHNLFDYSKEDIMKWLFELGIKNIGSNEMDPYQKLGCNSVYKTLIINALMKEPYCYLESFHLKMEQKELLEIIDAMIEIYNFEEVFIIVPSNHILLLDEWEESIKNTKIKLIQIEEYYALAHTRELVWQIKKKTYQKEPMEKGIYVFNVSTLLSIYQALKYRRPVIKMLVQFMGDMWKNNCYMEVRIGTILKEILEKLEFKRAKEVLFLSGSLMKGQIANLESSIFFDTSFYSAWKVKEESCKKNCIRCGKCIEVCPAGLNPVFIMEGIQKKRDLSRFHIERCMECGLCSYVCPSKILIHQMILNMKEEIK